MSELSKAKIKEKIKEEANKWRATIAQGAVDEVMAELDKITDKQLVEAVSRNVKVKIKLY